MYDPTPINRFNRLSGNGRNLKPINMVSNNRTVPRIK